MGLVFRDILLRLAGSWELLGGAQTKGDGTLGKKKAVEGDGAFGSSRKYPEHILGSQASGEHGLNPVAEGSLSSKWRERLHFSTSGAAPVCPWSGGLHISRSCKARMTPRKPELLW